MPQEIERKFLVDPSHPELAAILRSGGLALRQGYLRDLSAVSVATDGVRGDLHVAPSGVEPVHLAIPAEEAAEIIRTLCREDGTRHVLAQGVARIRIAGPEAWLTIKGRTSGVERSEFEYPVPPQAAEALLAACGAVLRKRRHLHPLAGGLLAEIDVFEQIDLVLAEVEVPDASTPIPRPAWFTREVSDDPSYFNNAIAARLEQGA